ncbi:MAG: hypothetical protein ACKO37_03265 [Vampirovibrionales bacterium]
MVCLMVALNVRGVYAQNLSDIPRPQTIGEWGQLAVPAAEIQAARGASANNEPVNLLLPQNLTQIEAAFLELLQKEGTWRADAIQWETPLEAQHPLASFDFTPYASSTLTLKSLATLAEQLQAVVQKYNTLFVIGFYPEHLPDGTEHLMVKLTPLTLGKLTIQGGKHFSERSIKRLLGFEEGMPLEPLTLAKRMRLIMDNPDIKLSGQLAFDASNHQTDLTLDVEDSHTLHASLFVNNLDQTFYGPQTAGVSFIANNLTGGQDTLVSTTITENRVTAEYLHYERPLNKHGTRLGIDYAYGRANPIGSDYDPYALRGRFWSLTTSVMQPIIAKRWASFKY